MSPCLLKLTRLCVLAAVTAGALACASHAQENAEAAAEMPAETTPRGVVPYDAKLLRLAEVLGSLQYLRNLCGVSDETVWRDLMEQLLDKETADEAGRRERLTAGYNRGYRTFASVYTACSDAAIAAESRYRQEGQALTSEIVARYGN